MALVITSPAFEEGGIIPRRHTCDGEDVSPPLRWTGVPQNVRSLALICDDPDAPARVWVHWVVYNVPATSERLPENILPKPEIAGGGLQGKNDFGKIGYGGPCPPSGTHRYYFKLYALDTTLKLPAGATKPDLLNAMHGHVLAETQLMGRYARKR